MIALYVGLYLVAGVMMGGVTYAGIKLGKACCPKGELGITVTASAIGWPVTLAIMLMACLGWLMRKGAEWVGERIMGVVARRKSDV